MSSPIPIHVCKEEEFNTLNVWKFPESFVKAKAFESFQGKVGLTEEKANELHPQQMIVGDQASKIEYLGRKSDMDTSVMWLMVEEAGKAKVYPVKTWVNFTSRIRPTAKALDLDQAERVMSRMRSQHLRSGENLVMKLRDVDCVEGDEVQDSDRYGLKAEARQKQQAIQRHARGAEYVAESEVPESAVAVTTIRTENAWDFEDQEEFSDDEAPDVSDEADQDDAKENPAEVDSDAENDLLTETGKEMLRKLRGEERAILDDELAELGLDVDSSDEERGEKRKRSATPEPEVPAKVAKVEPQRTEKDGYKDQLLQLFQRCSGRLTLTDVLGEFKIKSRDQEMYKTVVALLKEVSEFKDIKVGDTVTKFMLLKPDYQPGGLMTLPNYVLGLR